MGNYGGFDAMKKNKFPCNTTRFFFDKVNGKQFHAKYSGCDDFTVRLQIRKHPSVKWEKVALALQRTFWLLIFKQPGMSCANNKQLVSSFRSKKEGNHSNCLRASKSFKDAVRLAKRTGKKEIVYDWPINCKLRKK